MSLICNVLAILAITGSASTSEPVHDLGLRAITADETASGGESNLHYSIAVASGSDSFIGTKISLRKPPGIDETLGFYLGFGSQSKFSGVSRVQRTNFSGGLEWSLLDSEDPSKGPQLLLLGGVVIPGNWKSDFSCHGTFCPEIQPPPKNDGVGYELGLRAVLYRNIGLITSFDSTTEELFVGFSFSYD
ncbi:MAG: hypothetical protein DSY92_02115 [Planctomycetota bacterium]|nr:MAG: hypothetical protein DSY92_02115 [Planctomycetota bacterium]